MATVIIASLLAVVGYVIVWVTNRKEMKVNRPQPYLVVAAAVLTVGLIWWEYVEHRDELVKSQDHASALEKELKAARRDIAQLRAEEKAREPKLVHLPEKTEWRRHADTGLQHAFYVFRAQPPGPLRDIHIKLPFGAPFRTAFHRISGAIVEEQGSRLEASPDHRSLVFRTGVLREANGIVIEIVADRPLELQSPSLSP